MSDLNLLIKEIAEKTARLIGPYWSEMSYERVLIELLRLKGIEAISQKPIEIKLPGLNDFVFTTLKEDIYIPAFRCILELKHQPNLVMTETTKKQLQTYLDYDEDADVGYVIIFKKTDERVPKNPSDYKYYDPFISAQFSH